MSTVKTRSKTPSVAAPETPAATIQAKTLPRSVASKDSFVLVDSESVASLPVKSISFKSNMSINDDESVDVAARRLQGLNLTLPRPLSQRRLFAGLGGFQGAPMFPVIDDKLAIPENKPFFMSTRIAPRPTGTSRCSSGSAATS